MTQNERITEATMAELRKRIPEPDPARVRLIRDRDGRIGFRASIEWHTGQTKG